MKRNVSVVCVCSGPNCCNILISDKIIKDMSGSVASGTLCIRLRLIVAGYEHSKCTGTCLKNVTILEVKFRVNIFMTK